MPDGGCVSKICDNCSFIGEFSKKDLAEREKIRHPRRVLTAGVPGLAIHAEEGVFQTWESGAPLVWQARHVLVLRYAHWSGNGLTAVFRFCRI